MNNLSRAQFIALALVGAFIASIAGTALTNSMLSKNNLGLDIANLFPPVVGMPRAQEINERVLKQDELVVEAVENASKAVVSIVASKDVPVIEQYQVSPFGSDPFFRQFFGPDFTIPQYRQKGTQRKEVSSGTGFIISADGYILTNKHVVADSAAEYTVLMNDGTKLKAQVLARDPVEDLAIVKVAKSGLPTLALGDSSQIKIGQTAIAIGNSLGEFRNTVSVGVISGLQRSITATGRGIGTEDLSELIQTDAAINPGNSGGPLLNLRGEVIGINTAIVEGAQNIGFAIPINKAKRDIESLKKSGRIIYPYLGIRYVSLNQEIASQNKLSVNAGAWLRGDAQNSPVVPGSPADKAGLREGDIITEVNEAKIDADHNLSMLLQKYAVGDTVTLTVLRNGATQRIQVTLAERPQ